MPVWASQHMLSYYWHGWVSFTSPNSHLDLSSLHPASPLFPSGSFQTGRAVILPCLSKFSDYSYTLIFCNHIGCRHSERTYLDVLVFTREIIYNWHAAPRPQEDMEIVGVCETACRWQQNGLLAIKSEVPIEQTAYSFSFWHFSTSKNLNIECIVSLIVHYFFLPNCVKGPI